MTLRVLSLFSGAGGADLALEAAGMSVAALCEIEPHARAVLREHWPDVPLHGDVQTLDGTQYRGQVDVVVGGSPCQDLSVAGKRAGLGGERSGLFHEQVRIWQESEATYLIWENVKGAFSSQKGADFAAVLSALVGGPVAVPRDGWSNAGVVCGPTAVAAWRLLDLQHFGVPQRRERIVVLAARPGGVDPAEVLALGPCLSRNPPAQFPSRQTFARGAAAGVGVGGAISHTLSGEGCDASEDGTGRGTPVVAVNISDGTAHFGISSHAQYVADAVSTLRANGGDLGGGSENLVVTYDAQRAIPIDTRNATRTTDKDAQNRQGLGVGEDGDPSPTLTGLFTPAVFTYDARGNGDGAVANTLAGDHQNRVTDYTALVVDKNTAHVEKGAVSPTLKTDLAHDMGPVVLGEQPRTLAFKVRGGVEVDSAGKTAGNGYLGSEEVAFTLSGTQDQQIHQGVAPTITMGAHPAAPGLNGQDAVQFAEALISAQPGVPRRLMPIETERLMGWPDEWTRWGVNEKGVRYELADTPRYKLCGNGIGREWMEWVALRLMEAEGLTSEK